MQLKTKKQPRGAQHRHRTQTGNRRGPDGERCPLHCAAARGHVECATALLIAGANPAETEKSSGRTCSELAEEGGHDRLAGMIRGAAAAADGWPLLMDGSPSSRRRVRTRLGTRKEGAFEPGEGAASIAHPAPCHTLSACRPTHAPHGQVVLGEKDFNKTRGKAFLIHSQLITEFCADFGVPTLMRGGDQEGQDRRLSHTGSPVSLRIKDREAIVPHAMRPLHDILTSSATSMATCGGSQRKIQPHERDGQWTHAVWVVVGARGVISLRCTHHKIRPCPMQWQGACHATCFGCLACRDLFVWPHML